MEADLPCPDVAELEAVIQESLPEDRMEAVARHLGECAKCQAALEAASGAQSLGLVRPPNGTVTGVDDLSRRHFVERMKASQTWDGTSPQEAEEDDLSFLTPSEKPELLGTLGSLEVLEIIGRGGMGLVLRAHDPELKRAVAVKVLSPILAANNAARERFIREARAVAAINHENVLPIYAVDRTGTLPYFTMPLIEGGTLQELLDQTSSPLEIEQVVHIARKIAAGLSAAHAQGLIHRDIKPGNILLNECADRVWIADFGLARTLEEPSVTMTGTLVGTPQFMAPEQLEDELPSTATDLFSFGAVLYYMATGQPAFAAKTTASTIRKVVEAKTKPAEEVNPAMPGWLSKLIGELIQKRPENRPASAQDVAAIFDKHSRPRTRRRRHRVIWLSSTAIALLAALIVYYWHWHSSTPGLFELNSNGKQFQTLAEAIDAAAHADTILIAAPYTRILHPLSFRDKTLTLQPAALGTRTALDFTPLPSRISPEFPRFETEGDLTLTGLTFIREHTREGHPSDPGFAPIIDFHGDRLQIGECRFEMQQAGRTGRSNAPMATIVFHGAGTCEITDSTFLHSNRGIVLLSRHAAPDAQGPLQLSLRQNVIYGLSSCLTFDHETPCPIRLELTGNVTSGRILLGAMPNHSWAEVIASASSNAFCLEPTMRPSLIRVQDITAFKEHFHWTGRDNVFASPLPQVRVERLPMVRITGYMLPSIGIALWDGWTEQISETDHRVLSLDDPIMPPPETPLGEITAEDLFPEELLVEGEA